MIQVCKLQRMHADTHTNTNRDAIVRVCGPLIAFKSVTYIHTYIQLPIPGP